MVGSGSLICQHCGQMGPMEIGCAVIIGLSVMAGSDGALHVPRPSDQEPNAAPWASCVKSSSRN